MCAPWPAPLFPETLTFIFLDPGAPKVIFIGIESSLISTSSHWMSWSESLCFRIIWIIDVEAEPGDWDGEGRDGEGMHLGKIKVSVYKAQTQEDAFWNC